MSLENHLELVRTGQTLNYHRGFVDYNDTSTTATPVTLLADTWTNIPNDGLGAFTNTRYAPPEVLPMLGAGGYIDCTNLALGSGIIIRPDYSVTPDSNNASLEFRYSLGDGAGAYTLEKDAGRLDKGAGIPYRRSLDIQYIYMGDENTRDNPIYLQVKLSTTGTLVNAGMVIRVDRT